MATMELPEALRPAAEPSGYVRLPLHPSCLKRCLRSLSLANSPGNFPFFAIPVPILVPVFVPVPPSPPSPPPSPFQTHYRFRPRPLVPVHVLHPGLSAVLALAVATPYWQFR